jgi:hypothetical protein
MDRKTEKRGSSPSVSLLGQFFIWTAWNVHHPLLFHFVWDFFIVSLTHTHQWLVFATCTRYRSNADDSTLSNCCCRSMALLNFSTHIRLINQMRPLAVYFSFSTGKCLSIIGNMFFSSDIETVDVHCSFSNEQIKVIWSLLFVSIGMCDVAKINFEPWLVFAEDRMPTDYGVYRAAVDHKATCCCSSTVLCARVRIQQRCFFYWIL